MLSIILSLGISGILADLVVDIADKMICPRLISFRLMILVSERLLDIFFKIF